MPRTVTRLVVSYRKSFPTAHGEPMSAVTADEFRKAMRSFPGAVSILTTRDCGQPAGMTLDGDLLSDRRPADAARLHQPERDVPPARIQRAGRFTVNAIRGGRGDCQALHRRTHERTVSAGRLDLPARRRSRPGQRLHDVRLPPGRRYSVQHAFDFHRRGRARGRRARNARRSFTSTVDTERSDTAAVLGA